MAKMKKKVGTKASAKGKTTKKASTTKVKASARKVSLKGSKSSPKNMTSTKIVEYKLFCEDSVRSLEDQVNYHISKGWAPVGGVVLQGQHNFMQTMIRKEV